MTFKVQKKKIQIESEENAYVALLRKANIFLSKITNQMPFLGIQTIFIFTPSMHIYLQLDAPNIWRKKNDMNASLSQLNYTYYRERQINELIGLLCDEC